MSNLALITLSDSLGSRQWRNCGKLWAASLLRHQWEGEILVHRNFSQPLFPVEKRNLCEEVYAPGVEKHRTKDIPWKTVAREHQLSAAGKVANPDRFGWVLLADADCIALRNLDHLFRGDGDVLVSSVRGVLDPGFIAVRGNRLHELVHLLTAAGGLHAANLAEVAHSDGWKVREFERGEVLRPTDPGVTLEDLADAAVIHFSGMKPEDKHRLAFAFHMMAVYGDKDGLFFDMMDS